MAEAKAQPAAQGSKSTQASEVPLTAMTPSLDPSAAPVIELHPWRTPKSLFPKSAETADTNAPWTQIWPEDILQRLSPRTAPPSGRVPGLVSGSSEPDSGPLVVPDSQDPQSGPPLGGPAPSEHPSPILPQGPPNEPHTIRPSCLNCLGGGGEEEVEPTGLPTTSAGGVVLLLGAFRAESDRFSIASAFAATSFNGQKNNGTELRKNNGTELRKNNGTELRKNNGTDMTRNNGEFVEDVALHADSDLFDDVVAVARPGGAHCSGVAVGRRHVLTARHCLPASHVLIGARVSEAIGEVRVSQTVVYPGNLDVALLELERDVIDASRVRRRTHGAPTGIVRLVGFGVNNFTKLTGFGVKRRIDIGVLDWGCDERRARKIGCDREREMVLPHSMGFDTCAGDSGGPVFEATPLGWRLLAITSRSIGGRFQKCGDGGVYVRVDAISEWIDRNTEASNGQE